MLAAAENLSQMEKYLPYLVLGIGVVAAGLFVAYFASETDRRKRIVGSILSLVLTAFSIFCITEGKGVKKGIDLQGGASFLVRVQHAIHPIPDAGQMIYWQRQHNSSHPDFHRV